ncbi:13394_t:CDS:2 [Funneliformis mosseae]|uniref:13394_t:CDS:1 n=1 Tax=Funneliformis mosseae TaxID=27381 RepID=A0A9N8YWC9_FUNMO|nr:13394_t:CDS:2 [Funneliformis mosseae]
MHHQPYVSTSGYVFPPETVVQTPVVISSDFFTCSQPTSVPSVSVSSVPFIPPALPLSMNPTLSLNMYPIDNSQSAPSQVSQIISPVHSPSPPLSILEYRDSPTADELDVPEFFQYSKEKYESAKSGCRRRRKSTRDEQCETSSMDGGDDVDDNARQVSILCCRN